MAFWAFDKISKAKNYVQKNFGNTINQILSMEPKDDRPIFSQKDISPSKQQSFTPESSFLQIIPKPPLPVAFQTQLQQYQKLCKLQQQIIANLPPTSYQQTRKQLQLKLKQLQQQQQQDKFLEDKQKIYSKYNAGQLSLQDIIEENMIMKQKIQELKVKQSYK